jgi:predicted Zn finger-like uncharacterized protein
MKCPNCQSDFFIKNGKTYYGKQRFKCKTCSRQFIENSPYKQISPETKALIERLILEKISLAGIARATGVSIRWLQNYVNKKYAEISQEILVMKKPSGQLTLQLDEMWSFVKNKRNKQWLWIALDQNTREIVGLYIGDRSKISASKLWQSLPPVYRQCAVCYTDFWESR